ncbi:hypothetical protein ACFSTC_48280 [Nonomuraea ferruginea]
MRTPAQPGLPARTSRSVRLRDRPVRRDQVSVLGGAAGRAGAQRRSDGPEQRGDAHERDHRGRVPEDHARESGGEQPGHEPHGQPDDPPSHDLDQPLDRRVIPRHRRHAAHHPGATPPR